MSMLQYCYELGIKYVTVYAFSIDNFRRKPEEVRSLMDLMLEKIKSLLDKESIVHEYGIHVYFIGNLALLSDQVRAAAEEVMEATSERSGVVLLVCVAYNSTDEIVQAVKKSCVTKLDRDMETIQLVDIEENMQMSVAPDPDILIRSSGETRLSNFHYKKTPGFRRQLSSVCPRNNGLLDVDISSELSDGTVLGNIPREKRYRNIPTNLSRRIIPKNLSRRNIPRGIGP
uniref:Alkyl transferase n=1 Tax=Brassica campestris TaxID=3711 RepID=M4CCZ3_BRACM